MPVDFASSSGPSIGVEVELELVDPDSRELVSGAQALLAEMGAEHGGHHPKAKPELLQSTIEIITGICHTAGDARVDLTATLDELQGHVARHGLALMCSGTHPFTDPATQEITPEPRYLQLVNDMQWPARQLQIFGIHVHIGVRSPNKAIAMVNALSAYIPHFLGLSASSPYWLGHDTGMSSWRSKIFEGLPTAGPPWQLSGWPEFESLMETLIAAKTISSIREVWWDIRPHPGFGTIEMRVCDGIPTLREVSVVAALTQCLVHQFDTQLDRGYSLPVPHSWLVRENKWRAARFGLDASIIVDDSGTTVPLRTAIAELIEDLTPVASRLRCTTELQAAVDIVRRGSSSVRQREIVAAGGSLRDVVDSLVAELRDDVPSEPPVRVASG